MLYMIRHNQIKVWYDQVSYFYLKYNHNDVIEAYKRSVEPAYTLYLPWAADVDCSTSGDVTINDVIEIYKRSVEPTYELHCCC
jgi:hypothetical protein